MATDLLAAGQPAPDFTAVTDDGTPLTLSSLRGRHVVLYFYPKDDTPGCTTEACDFRDSLEALTALGAEVLGVSPDSEASHRKFRAKHNLNFRLVADTDQAIAEAWGAWRTKSMYGKEYMGIVRSTFLIDADGVIRQAWDQVKVHQKTKAGTVRHVDQVREALLALQG
jgi:peroxiredoxin Q/BCP